MHKISTRMVYVKSKQPLSLRNSKFVSFSQRLRTKIWQFSWLVIYTPLEKESVN